MRPVLAMAANGLVGREESIALCRELVRDGRLVTLTGAPGVGKSRLAMAVAAAMGKDIETRRVDLAAVEDPAGVTPAVATALIDRPSPLGPHALDALVAWLNDQHLLLLLDNCDPTVLDCAALVEHLTQACPALRLLATSRERLRVPGELVVEVPPLTIPGVDLPPDQGSLECFGAVQLFLERAAAVCPGLAQTADIASAVADICRSVDGLPLAIELAAARLDVLTPPQLAERLGDPMAVLTGGPRTAPPRHRSMRAALDWSYHLLDDSEQALLRRLAVFADGGTLDAVEQVCAGTPVEPSEVLQVVARLAGKSLVASDTTGHHGRYRLLHTIRSYASQRLAEADEAEPMRAAHAEWAARFAEEAERGFDAGDQQSWLARVEAEQANLHAALGWATTTGHGELGLRLAGAMAPFWQVRGHYHDGRRWLQNALEAGHDAPHMVRAKALSGLALLAGLAGDEPAGTAAARESLDLAREYGDRHQALRALAALGALRLWPDPVASLPELQRAVVLARQAQDQEALAEALTLCARAYMWRSEVDNARPLFEESLEVARRSGNQLGTARGLIGLGWVLLLTADRHAGESMIEEGLGIARSLGAVYETAEALSLLGELARLRGEHTQGKQLLDECLAHARTVGSPVLLARAHTGLGRLAHAAEDLDAARAELGEAIRLAREGRFHFILVRCLLALADVATDGEDPDASRVLAEEALAVAEDSNDRHGKATALHKLACVADYTGDPRRAAALHAKALQLRADVAALPGLADSLSALADLAARQGRWTYATRLWGSAHNLRHPGASSKDDPPDDHDRPPRSVDAYAELGEAAFREAWAEGAAMPWKHVVAYACRGRGPRPQATHGWEALTPAEQQVASLARQRLSNAEIGKRLFIATRTVGNHLYHIYAKLGISSRKDLDRVIPPEDAE